MPPTTIPKPPLPLPTSYYCTGGSATPRPLNSSEGGFPCPQGYYCPVGSSVPLGCIPGSYNDQLARNACMPCPAGRMCDLSNMTTPVDCKQGACVGGCGGCGRVWGVGRCQRMGGVAMNACMPCPAGRMWRVWRVWGVAGVGINDCRISKSCDK